MDMHRSLRRYLFGILATAIACSSTHTIATTQAKDRALVETVTGRFVTRDGREVVLCVDRARSFCKEDPCKKRMCHDATSGREETFEEDQSAAACDCYGCECSRVSEGVALTARIFVSGVNTTNLPVVGTRIGPGGSDNVVELAYAPDGGDAIEFRAVSWIRIATSADACGGP
jgi:hypothetical protein